MDVFFDDFLIRHRHSPLIQMDDYYPFGMGIQELAGVRSGELGNGFLFQGQEHQNETGWDSFKWRNHQPDLGRFFNIDPLAEDFEYNSPYAFSENKLGMGIELEGKELSPFIWLETATTVASLIEGSEMSTTIHTAVSIGPQAGIDLPGVIDVNLNIASVELAGYDIEQSESDTGPIKKSFNYVGKEGKTKIKQGISFGAGGISVGGRREFNAKSKGGYSDMKDEGNIKGALIKMSYSEKENKNGSTDQTMSIALTGGVAFIIGVEGSLSVKFNKKKEKKQ